MKEQKLASACSKESDLSLWIQGHSDPFNKFTDGATVQIDSIKSLLIGKQDILVTVTKYTS